MPNVHAASTDPPRCRRWQFRLRTLLLLVTFLSVVFAGMAWWVTLPLQTWQRFIARLEAGDIEGANALCDAETLRITADGSSDGSSSTQTRDVKRSRSAILELALRAKFGPRHWSVVLQGRQWFVVDMQADERLFTIFEVDRGKVRYDPIYLLKL